MTREEIEKNPNIDPVDKLVVEFLSRQEDRVFDAKEISTRLGLNNGQLIDRGFMMRGKMGLLAKEHRGEHLPMAMFMLSRGARAAYCVADDSDWAIEKKTTKGKK